MIAVNSVLDECESTNDHARELGEQGFPHGSWISTRRQTKGRGRQGRSWESQDGNLFFSMLARISDRTAWSWVPLTTAVAVLRTVQELKPELAQRVRIKWPNDIWIDQAKLAGILCEAVVRGEGSFLVIGIGMNCESAPQIEGQLTACLGIHADQVRATLARHLLEGIALLNHKNGTQQIAQVYQDHALFRPGSQVEWGEGKQGQVCGLGPASELLVETDSGPQSLFAEDVKIRAVLKAGDESLA